VVAHAGFLDRTAVALPAAFLCSAVGLSLLWSRGATSRSPS
jgi:preprotein translocase subunit SecG